ncbi:MAG: FtsW/RodA/SpoVE family cell cycle protein, partial [Armatimonadetes bacterium]|nr:FtsW/RodA/SpoVE family cell cycle protein [Armatimonadota bacterium]
AGVTVAIVVQALLNIAVVTGSLPATGVPLPFVSYGGSSLLFSLVGVGLLLNAARRQAVDDGDRETP